MYFPLAERGVKTGEKGKTPKVRKRTRELRVHASVGGDGGGERVLRPFVLQTCAKTVKSSIKWEYFQHVLIQSCCQEIKQKHYEKIVVQKSCMSAAVGGPIDRKSYGKWAKCRPPGKGENGTFDNFH